MTAAIFDQQTTFTLAMQYSCETINVMIEKVGNFRSSGVQ